MDPPQPAIDFVASYCDIVDRLAVIPPSARVRGIYMRLVESEIELGGKAAEYRLLFPSDTRWSAMGYYPLGEYLVRLACAGALLISPERVHDGMCRVTANYAARFAQSLLGRTLIRLLSRDPVRLSEQALASRRQTCSYGLWELRYHGERQLEMVYHNEYVWIESAIAGAARGTFEACGVHSMTMETRLRDRFNGSTLLQW